MKVKLHPTICPLCHKQKNWEVLYPQNFSVNDFNVDVFSARRLPDRLHYQLVKCKADGMVRSNPVVDLTVLSTLYTKSKFTYEGETENLTISYLRAIEPVLQNLHKKDLIVEVGCGNGFILNAICKLGYTNVMGVEPSIDAIRKAPKKLQLKMKRSLFTPKLFKKNSVSFVFIFQTLDHIPEPDKFLKDVYSVLKPGGYLLSFHHNVESWSAHLLGEKSPIFDVEHTQLFSLDTSRRIFEAAGFTVESNYSPTSTVSLKHLAWLFPFPKSVKRSILSQETELTKWLSTHTLSLPMGNVCVVGRK